MSITSASPGCNDQGSASHIHRVHRFNNMYPWSKLRVVHVFFLEEYRVTSSEQAGKNDI